MKIIRNHLPLVLLITVYLITRLYNLLLLPIFTDESIYIYWAKIIATTSSHWFISLTDGKPPLFIWMISAFLTILPSHWYLFAGRLPSVIAGALTLFGIYKLSLLLFKSPRIAIIGSLLYIASPFSLLYDRMSLFDSLLTSMLLWAVYFALKTAKTKNTKDALLWGIFLGLAYLSKPTAVIFLFLTPICFLLMQPQKEIRNNWKKIPLLIGIPLVLGNIIINLPRLSSVYYLFEGKNQQFQQPLEQLLKEPFALTWGSLHGFFAWIIPYYTEPTFIIGFIAFLILLKKKIREGLLLFILWFAPIFILSTVGREIFPRYILFTTPYFLIAIAYLINFILNFKKRVTRGGEPHSPTSSLVGGYGAARCLDPQIIIGIIVVFLILIPSLRFDYFLLTNPPAAPIPTSDYNQYISEHPSGYGLDSVFAFLDNELKNEPVTLVTQGTFGLYPYAFNLEYWDNKNLTIVPRWPLGVLDQEIYDRAQTQKTYILLKEHDKIPDTLPLKLVLKAEKPGRKYPLILTTLK